MRPLHDAHNDSPLDRKLRTLRPCRRSQRHQRSSTDVSEFHCADLATTLWTAATMAPMSDVTQILAQIDEQNPAAAEQLFTLVYEELRKLAAVQLAREKPGQTLQATALVHEAYVRLVGGGSRQQWSGRNHFFAAAAEAMRRILVDNARRKATVKHGGQHDPSVCSTSPRSRPPPRPTRFWPSTRLSTAWRPRTAIAAELVKLHYFGGFSLEEAAELARHLPRNRLPYLDLCPHLAPRRAAGSSGVLVVRRFA